MFAWKRRRLPCAEVAGCRPSWEPTQAPPLVLPSCGMQLADSSAMPGNRVMEQQREKKGSLVEETWGSQPL